MSAVPAAVVTCFAYTNVIKENTYVRGDLTKVINFLLARHFQLGNIHVITDLIPEQEEGPLRAILEYLAKVDALHRISNIVDYTNALINVVSNHSVMFMYWSCHATKAGIVCPSQKAKLQVCPAKTLTNIIMLSTTEKMLCIIDCCHADAMIDRSIFPPNLVKKDLIFMFSCTADQNSGVIIDQESSLFTYYVLKGLSENGELLFKNLKPTFNMIAQHRDEEGKSAQTPLIRTTKNRNRFFEWV